MSIAIFEILEGLDKDTRKKQLAIIQENFQYNLLFKEINDNKKPVISFYTILRMLEYFNIKYEMGDNIYEKIIKVKESDRYETEGSEKKRKIKPTILSFLRLVKQLRLYTNNYRRYKIMYDFFTICNDVELKWAVTILINKNKIRELIK